MLVPAFVAGVIWLIAGRLWRRPAAPTLVWGGSLAVALSFFSGHVALMGRPPFPPVTAIHTLVYGSLLAGVIGIGETVWRFHWALRWTIRAVLAGGATWWQFKTLAEHSWTTAQTWGWLITITFTVCAMWDALDTFAHRNIRIATPLVLWLFACATSVALVFGASAMMGQLASCVAAMCGAAIVLTLWSGRFPLDRGAAGLYAFITTGLLWQGYFYAELPLLSTAMLVATPVAVFAIDALAPAKTKSLHRMIAAFTALLVLAGGAIWIAYLAYRTAAAEIEEYVY